MATWSPKSWIDPVDVSSQVIALITHYNTEVANTITVPLKVDDSDVMGQINLVLVELGEDPRDNVDANDVTLLINEVGALIDAA